MSKIIWAMSVWGESHIDMFNRHHVPSMLLEGNLDWLQQWGDVEFYLMCKEGEQKFFERGLQQIEKRGIAITVEGFLFSKWGGLRNLQILVELQRIAVKRALQAKAGLVYTFPDTIMPVLNYARLGRKEDIEKEEIGAFVYSGFGVRKEEALWGEASFEEFTFLHSRGDMIENLVQENLMHPFIEASKVGEFGPTTNWPCALFWKNNAGIVSHSFHKDAAICWPSEVNWGGWMQAMDIDFTQNTKFRDREGKQKIVTAKDFLVIEIAEEKKKTGLVGNELQISDNAIALWAVMHSTKRNIKLFDEQLRLSGHYNAEAALHAKKIQAVALKMLERAEELKERKTKNVF